MFLKKGIDIARVLLRFEKSRYRQYRTDMRINICSKVAYLAMNLLFWYIITDTRYVLAGWGYRDIMVYIAFSELFYGLDNAVFGLSSRFWRYMYSGVLDTVLVRPFEPRIRFLVLNINYVELSAAIVEFAVLFTLAKGNWKRLLWGVLVVFAAEIILSWIRFCLSYLAFWHGKMEAVSELSDSISSFNKYPLVIMPKTTRIVFQFVLPFYFFSTYPAELVNFGWEAAGVWLIGGIISNFVIWYALYQFLWRKGMERYESISG